MIQVIKIIFSFLFVFVIGVEPNTTIQKEVCLYSFLEEIEQNEDNNETYIAFSQKTDLLSGGNDDDNEVKFSSNSENAISKSAELVFFSIFFPEDIAVTKTVFRHSSHLPLTFSRPRFFILYHSFKADIA
jgi:hypothetical protein